MNKRLIANVIGFACLTLATAAEARSALVRDPRRARAGGVLLLEVSLFRVTQNRMSSSWIHRQVQRKHVSGCG